MLKNKFFITTPIYYTNWIPHIGHSYSSYIADIIARYQKISWKKVKFSTWVDENSQKAVLKAEENNMKIVDYLDMMAEKHKEVWDWLWIQYTDFIRTTEKRHHDLVRKVLQKSYDAWDIYEWIYEWLYCVWCEWFKKDDDLIELKWKKVCPDHLKEPEKIKEKNYFFNLSKYQNFLKNFYKNNPEFVIPHDRYNEVIAFVERWLDDFSVSRETNKFWIALPFDENQVTYVWYDALFNYVTVCENQDEEFWPADLHVVWKDIIRFHAIYWPAMLKSAWYDLPKQILTTWFFTIDWQKISKSLWNVIEPVEFIQKYNKDLLILYLLSSFNIWQDWDFNEKQAILTYNSKMANNLWNLLNRVVVLALKLQELPWELYGDYFAWDFEFSFVEIWKFDEEELEKYSEAMYLLDDQEKVLDLFVFQYFDKYNLKWVLDTTFSFLDRLNKFADEKTPWISIKDPEKQAETRNVLYTIAEWLRIVGLILFPFFPEKMDEMFKKLWLDLYKKRLENWELKFLIWEKTNFSIKEKWKNLYDRFDV